MPRKPAKPASRTQKQLSVENEDLRYRLAEAEEILRAIRTGEVDAILVTGPDGDQIFTLKQAEDALQKAKDRAQVYLDIAAMMFLVLTADGKVVLINKRGCEILGYAEQEIVGLNWSDHFLPQAEKDRVSTQFGRIMSDGIGQLEYFESHVLTKNGQERLIGWHSAVLTDEDDKTIGIVSSGADITERRQVEAALQASEERYRTLFQTMDQGFCVIEILFDADGKAEDYRYMEVNPAFENQTGLLQAQGKTMRQLVPNHEPHWFEIYGKVAQTGESLRFQEPANAMGNYYDVFAFRIGEDGSRKVGVLFRDITESKRAEAELRREKQFLETLNLYTPVAITVLDEGGDIISYNPAFERMFGYAPSEIVGKNLDILISTGETIQDDAANTLQAREGPVHAFGKRRRKDGQLLTVELFGLPVPLTEEKNGILAIYHDVTEQENARREAEQSNRAKGEFVANMSHELRTPMNGVIGMLELALDTILTTEQREYLQTSLQSAESLLTLLNDILDFSKIEAGRLSIDSIDFNLRTTVENVADTLVKRAQEKGLEVACLVHPDLVSELRGDPARLRQILVNLAGNAIKFTHQGEVVIQADLTEDTPEHVIIHFAVQDTGVGIPLERQAAIFDRFTQADGSTTRKYGGTGLGLTISKQLVEMMGGTMGLDSIPGVGSTFWFNLKFEKQPHGKPGTAPLSLGLANLSYARILIVDDNQTNRTVLTRNIQAFGSQVDSVPSGAEGLEVLRNADRAGAPYHVVLLDMQMPGMDGEQTARAIKSDPAIKDVKIIILTSLGQRGDASRLEALGCSGYLLKPVKQQILFDAVITVMGREKEEGPGLITRHILSEQRKSHLRLLLAEDNPINQKLAIILLQKAGYSVDAVETGLQALKKVQANQYNAVLMDVQMTEMDGFEATQQIREWEQERGTHIPIIAMTAHAMLGDRERCLEAGMDDYITKPLEPQVLFSALDRWIQAPGPDRYVEMSTSVEAMQDYSSPASFQAADLDDGLFGESRPSAEIETEVETPAFQTISFTGISPADFEAALPHFDNDRDFMLEMFKEYKTHLGERVDEIHAALLDRDTNRLARLAHNLKGISQNFSADPLATISLQLEEICKREDLTHAPRLVAQLDVEARRLDEFLSKNL